MVGELVQTQYRPPAGKGPRASGNAAQRLRSAFRLVGKHGQPQAVPWAVISGHTRRRVLPGVDQGQPHQAPNRAFEGLSPGRFAGLASRRPQAVALGTRCPVASRSASRTRMLRGPNLPGRSPARRGRRVRARAWWSTVLAGVATVAADRRTRRGHLDPTLLHVQSDVAVSAQPRNDTWDAGERRRRALRSMQRGGLTEVLRWSAPVPAQTARWRRISTVAMASRTARMA
jgi:hypothetical protein